MRVWCQTYGSCGTKYWSVGHRTSLQTGDQHTVRHTKTHTGLYTVQTHNEWQNKYTLSRLLWLMSNPDLSPCPGVCCIVFCARVEDGGSVLLILPKKKLFGELLVNGGFIAVWEHLPRHKINNINVIVSYANVCVVCCVSEVVKSNETETRHKLLQ